MLSITVCSSNSLSTRHASVFSQDSRSMARTEDKETFLVTLTQPRLYVQQIAFDKGEQINSKQRTKSSNLQRCTISFSAKLIVVSNFKDSCNNCGVSVNLITLIQSAYITFSTIIGFRVFPCRYPRGSRATLQIHANFNPHWSGRGVWKWLSLRLLGLVH